MCFCFFCFGVYAAVFCVIVGLGFVFRSIVCRLCFCFFCKGLGLILGVLVFCYVLVCLVCLRFRLECLVIVVTFVYFGLVGMLALCGFVGLLLMFWLRCYVLG